jgi:hypothetical protein
MPGVGGGGNGNLAVDAGVLAGVLVGVWPGDESGDDTILMDLRS